MSRIDAEDNYLLVLQVHPDDSAVLKHAAATEHTNMADFVLHHALEAARKVIEQAEPLTLSGRDSVRVLDVLENPPVPKDRLLTVAYRMSKRS